MRSSKKEEAVAREPSVEERSVEICLWVGGVKESCVVARKRERVVDLESNAALLCEALSLIMFIRFVTVSFVMFLLFVSSLSFVM